MSHHRLNRSEGLNRRRFLRTMAVGSVGGFFVSRATPLRAQTVVSLPFANGQRTLVQFPQKRPLILLTMRPPQLETPFDIFNEGVLTPNDAFFVRYHLAGIPTTVDSDQFRLAIKGRVATPVQLSLTELKTRFESAEVVAVNQCSGNGRGFSQPRVAGGQMGNGAMGCARWKGVRLKDLLNRAGVAAGAKQAAFRGLDKPVTEKTPGFAKALDLDHALDGEVLLAYQMNGAALPMLNGYPLRLVVPGYYGTYWVKHVTEITVLAEEFDGYWMRSAYRIPDNAGACVEPGTTPKSTKPIARLNVRSFITSLADGVRVSVGQPLTVRGIAFDGGYGLAEVRFSDDGGKTWREADLGRDYGKYAFREWTAPFTPQRAGNCELKVCATNRIGQSQPVEALWNPPGYMRNVIETVRVSAS
jgi:DMSO/TMAO reductase YedYZ molybdopterin-dependent catalytic subunit